MLFTDKKRFTKFRDGKIIEQFAEGCFKFEYSGFEVSLSTHEMKPSLHVYSHTQSVVFALDYIDGDAVKQAIDFIDNAVYVNGKWSRRQPAQPKWFNPYAVAAVSSIAGLAALYAVVNYFLGG